MTFVRDTFWVAVYEVGEAVRTRLFQLGTLAYLGGIGFGNAVLIYVLHEMEASVAETLGVPSTRRPGAMMSELLKSDQLLDMVSPLAGDPEIARKLLQEPILGLWASAVAMALLPLLLLFSASGSVASEVHSRSIRYLLVRTGRLQIGLGKLLGQLLFGVVAAGLGILVTVVMGATLMVDVPLVPLLGSLLDRACRALVYALPWLGIGLGISQLVPSPNGARFLGMATFVATPIFMAWREEHLDTSFLGRLLDLSELFVPLARWAPLWSTVPGEVAAAAVHCVVLGVVFFAIGYTRFDRSDL